MPETTPRITSAKLLAALSHPSRRRLLDVLAVDGPSMVTTIADRTQLAVGSVSHHLGVMAAAGLVEEAPEMSRDRRERWWRTARTSISWSTTDFEDNPSDAVVAEAAVTMNLEHHLSKLRGWRALLDEADKTWKDAAFASDYWLRLSAQELAQLSVELNELLGRWKDRGSSTGDAARESVFVFVHGFPAAP